MVLVTEPTSGEPQGDPVPTHMPRTQAGPARVTGDGWECEPDQRHAEITIKSLGMEEAIGVREPGEDERAWEEE